MWIDKIEQQQQVKDHWKSDSEEFQISSRRWIGERRNGKSDKEGNKLNVNFSNLNYSSFINDFFLSVILFKILDICYKIRRRWSNERWSKIKWGKEEGEFN